MDSLKDYRRAEQRRRPGAIELRHVDRSFDTPAGAFFALRDVSLDIAPGELVAVVGASGSGKSTLLNLVAGIDRPSAGEIWVSGTPLHGLSENELARFRGRGLGVVFQFFQLLPTLTAVENVILPMDFLGEVPPRERRRRAEHLLERVGIAHQAMKFPEELSGGQQQRVAIARALANDPLVLVADEPTGNLDTRTASQVLSLLADLAAGGKTVVLVTHERELEPRFSRVLEIVDGQLSPSSAELARETQQRDGVASCSA